MSRDKEQIIANLQTLGISYDDGTALRRIAMTLHRWAEREAGDSSGWALERDDETGRPYVWNTMFARPFRRQYVNDLEKGALARLGEIVGRYPDLAYYEQGDCRGAPLYIYRKQDLGERKICSCYSNVAIAVYK